MQIKEIFSSMEYGPAPESPELAHDRLDGHGRKFAHFINGAFTKPGKTFASTNPASEEKLADISNGTKADVDKAVKAARDALQPLRLAVPDDVVAATQVAKANDWANVYLLSRSEDDLVEDLFMNPLRDLEDCRRILDSCESVAFVESAQYAYARLRVPV